ncbi:MAG: asparaginase, partial [Butyricicoccus sp.]|nr:asparaginase [Butyricicoccus sp.]
MKRILLIATGGTISCRDTGLGLAPALTGEELLEFLPEAASLCRITVINPFTLDSTNITTENRVQIAKLIQENYDLYDGFVITHGTDSL